MNGKLTATLSARGRLKATLSKAIERVEPIIKPIEITENGNYSAPAGVHGFNPVNVNVPLKYDEGYNDGYQASQDSITLQEKTITENGEYTPDNGYSGFSKVNVNVPNQFEDLNDVLTEQEELIEELQGVLKGKASGGGGESGLPNGYTRVDYIQFTGKELVDTGIIGNQDTQINISFTWESTAQRHLFGCASADNTASITSYMNGSWRFGNKYSSKNLSTKNPKLPYSALIDKTAISLNSSIASISGVNDFETVGTLLLGGARDTDGSLPSVMITGKVFYFYMWQGDEMVLKLIPVVSAEGHYRFFDMISKAFFDSITDTALEGGNI